MRKRAKVAARTDGALRWDYGVNPFVEIGDHLIQRLQSDARITPREGVDAKQHGSPDDIFGKWLSHSAGMAFQEVFLEFFAQFGRDRRRRQIAEAGGDAINRFSSVSPLLHHRRASRHEGSGSGIQGNAVTVSGYAHDVLDGERMPIEPYNMHSHRLLKEAIMPFRNIIP